MSEKSCTVCKQTKPLSDFSPCRNGHQPSCKVCRNQRARAKDIAVSVSQKRCASCGETKQSHEFNRSKHHSDGLQSRCKVCDRTKKVARNYEVTLSEKTCVDCGITKKASEFPRDRNRVGGLRKECRECASIRCRATIYSLSFDQCKAMCAVDDCEICGRRFSETSERNIDHCHATGIVRGTLCAPCNKMLGAAFDSPATLESAARYLRARSLGVSCG